MKLHLFDTIFNTHHKLRKCIKCGKKNNADKRVDYIESVKRRTKTFHNELSACIACHKKMVEEI